MLQDLRFALRTMRRSPGFTLIVVLCLALGIGANSAMFGILDALLFRPPAGVGRPDGVRRIDIHPAAEIGGPFGRGGGEPRVTAASYPDFTDLRDRSTVFSAVAAYTPAQVTLGQGESAENLLTILVSGAYFPLLDVTPALGHFFPADEDRTGNQAPLVVLSYDFWRRRFNADHRVLGKTLLINGNTFTVIGVAPNHFTGVDLGAPDVWLPLFSTTPPMGAEHDMRLNRFAMWLRLIARIKPGITDAHATSETNAIIEAGDRAFEREAPPGGLKLLRGPARVAALAPITAHVDRAAGQESPVPLWLLAVTGAVLLIACANVASLLLARGAARRREIAIRFSLGASQPRLARQLLTESVLLALLAGIAGLVIALWSVQLLHLLPIPPIDHPIDARIALLTLALGAATSLVFGIVPTLHAAHTPPGDVLRDETTRASARRLHLRNGLTIAQIALSLVLLVGAGLFFRSLRNLQAIDMGFDVDHLLLASVDLHARGYSDAAITDFYRRALDRVRALPGIEDAALATAVPFRMFMMSRIDIPDRKQPGNTPLVVSFNNVGPDYFETMGIALRAGRRFQDTDRAETTPVAIINETMARRYWPGESALGRCFRTDPTGPCFEIVGVVRDAKYAGLQQAPEPYFYRPVAQEQQAAAMLTLHIRTHSDPERLASAVRHAIQTLDPNLPFVTVSPLAQTLAPELTPWRVGMTAFAIFGALALTLAMIGLYGVVAFLVTQRTREVGVRMALGAQRSDVMALILGHALRLTAAGIVAGVIVALATMRLLAHRLYGVTPADPITFAGVAILLGVVALGASLIPALRAARVDPVVALRYE